MRPARCRPGPRHGRPRPRCRPRPRSPCGASRTHPRRAQNRPSRGRYCIARAGVVGEYRTPRSRAGRSRFWPYTGHPAGRPARRCARRPALPMLPPRPGAARGAHALAGAQAWPWPAPQARARPPVVGRRGPVPDDPGRQADLAPPPEGPGRRYGQGTITLDDHGRRVQDCAATAPARLPAGGLHQGQDCGMPPGRSGLARRMALKRATSRAIAPAGPGKAPVPPRPFRAFLGPLLALRGPLCAATWPLKACPPPRPHAKQAILPPRWPAPPRRRTTKLGPQIAAKTFLCRNVPATISSGG